MSNYKDLKHKNLVDTGTEGTKLASGTTGQRGTTTGAFRLNTTIGLAEYYTGSTHKIIDTPPTVTSVDDDEVDSAGGGNQTIVITGTNFSSGAVASFIGSSASFNAATTTVDSSTQITAVAPKSSFLNAQEPYGVKVLNTSGLSATLASAINVDNAPSWTTTAGSLGTVYEDEAMSTITVAATDAEGDTVAYSVQSGAIPTGTNLGSANGQITGTPNVSDTYASAGVTHSFDLRATAGAKTSDRSFSILRKWMDGSTAAQAQATATAIKTLTGTTTDGGYYIIDPSDSNNKILTYCNMSFDGGGWVLVHSSRSSTWDGVTGSQSTTNYYDTGTLAEYTSGVPHDIYSKLRTNFPFTELLIEWSANTDMSSPTDRPVYTTGSVNGLINLSANTTLSRKGGNSDDLPNTNYTSLGTGNDNYLYYKKSGSGQDRQYIFSNCITNSLNQNGFYWWGGQHGTGEWCAAPSETVATVSFYVK